MKIKNMFVILSLTMLQNLSASIHEPVGVDVQYTDNIFYNAKKYPNGPAGIAKDHHFTMAMDANGVMFDQDESIGTRLRLMNNLAAKQGWSYALWAAKKGLSIKSEKTRLQKAGDARGYCSDAIMLMVSFDEQDTVLLETLRAATLEVVTPNIEVAHMLTMLNRHGNHVAVLSNMGDQLLYLQAQILKEKIDNGALNPQQQEASEFLYKVITDNAHNVVANSLTGRPHKPDAAIYTTFLKKNSHLGHRLTILVDDKLENIEAAVANGFIGILCKKHKAAQAMRKALPLLTGKTIEELFVE